MRSDDLASLLRHADGDIAFHQGRILSWDPNTGENSVRVRGTPLQNLPILNTGEAIALREGHVVGVLRVKSSYFILGRVTVPGTPEFASASVGFEGDWGTAVEFDVPTTGLQIVIDIPVPPWADEALVFVAANTTVVNTAGNPRDFIFFEALLDDSPGRPAYPEIPFNAFGFAAASAQRVINVSGRSLFSVGARWRSWNTTWPAHGSNIVNFDATATFRSVT